MNVRSLVSVSAAALVAAAALAVPTVHAQAGGGEAGGGTGSLSPDSLSADGSLGDGGSLGADPESGSLPGLASDAATDVACDLPELGGSVAKFYPLLGISGIPSAVVTLAASVLDAFPNLLDVVAGEGGGAALVGRTGSLSGPLCTTVLGGRLTTAVTPVEVTVVVDRDGNPLTTIGGAPAAQRASERTAATTTSTLPTTVPTAASPTVSAADGGPAA